MTVKASIERRRLYPELSWISGYYAQRQKPHDQRIGLVIDGPALVQIPDVPLREGVSYRPSHPAEERVSTFGPDSFPQRSHCNKRAVGSVIFKGNSKRFERRNDP